MKKSELNSWRLIKDQKLNDVAGKCALRIYRNWLTKRYIKEDIYPMNENLYRIICNSAKPINCYNP